MQFQELTHNKCTSVQGLIHSLKKAFTRPSPTTMALIIVSRDSMISTVQTHSESPRSLFFAFLVLPLPILCILLSILLLHAKGFRERLTQVIGVL